jgi:DivIVA domain-containing protein
MADDLTADHIVISSGRSLSTEEVATRTFSSSFRGYDQSEVRLFLKRVSSELAALADNERQLRQSLDEARDRAAHPELDEGALTSALGEQTTRILQSAREAAADIRNKAEENASRTLREAEEEAARLRTDAETVLNERIDEANRVAAGIREATMEECAALRERAASDSASEVETARSLGKEMVGEAQAVRERLLGDLARRRRLAHVQIEQLRAGRERLLEAYRVVRRTLDEATEELTVAEAEARLAAEAAARRSAAEEPELSAEDMEVELAGADEQSPAVAEPASSATAEAVADATATPEPAMDLSRGERRSSGLRILGQRRRHSAADDGAVLVEVERPSDVEGVRVLTGEPDRTADSPSVDEIFSRIRADREAAVNRIQEAPPVAATGDASSGVGEESTETARPDRPERDAGAEGEPAASDADETVLQRRDEVLEPLGAQLVRQLKRALQDEQNEVLDRLRTARGAPQPDAVLLTVSDQARRYRDVAEPLLAQAAEAGAKSATGGNGQSELPVANLANELATELVGPLRDRLVRAFDAATGNDEAIVESLGAGYRQWKAERIEPVTRHHLAAAFSVGSYTATPADTSLRWLVDDDEGACPDCDDNALAGPTTKGTVFPTGQAHPPAHAGCRCLLVPITADAATIT